MQFRKGLIIDKIQQYMLEDKDYQKLKHSIVTGKWSKAEPIERAFYRHRFQLTIEEDVIYYGNRVFVPKLLVKDVLMVAHETHQGRQAMINNVSQEFWWPKMINDIIKFIQRCEKCCAKQPLRKSHLASWPSSSKWERVHIDWAFPANFGPLLIVVDSGTNFIDAFPCSDRSLQTVKRCLARLFGFFGLPSLMVSDNAPEFVGLQNWLASLGVRLMHSPPYNPASNGQAERAVRTIKDSLKCYEPKLGDKFIFLQKVLLNHRCCSGITSPAEKLYNFKPRTMVNLNFPIGQDMVFKNKQLKTASPVKYIVQAGQNTAWVSDNSKTWLASLSQLTPVHKESESEVQTHFNWRSKRRRKQPTRLVLQEGKSEVKSNKKRK